MAITRGSKRTAPSRNHRKPKTARQGTFKDWFPHTRALHLHGCHFCGEACLSSQKLHAHDCQDFRTFQEDNPLLYKSAKVFLLCGRCGDYSAFSKQDQFQNFIAAHERRFCLFLVVYFAVEEPACQQIVMQYTPRYSHIAEDACAECSDRPFQTIDEAEAHYRRKSHENQLPSYCTGCDEGFALKPLLWEHLVECEDIDEFAQALADLASNHTLQSNSPTNDFYKEANERFSVPLEFNFEKLSTRSPIPNALCTDPLARFS
ncbi:unnamed protein product, partial [Mesorhabditis spiculigera]